MVLALKLKKGSLDILTVLAAIEVASPGVMGTELGVTVNKQLDFLFCNSIAFSWSDAPPV